MVLIFPTFLCDEPAGLILQWLLGYNFSVARVGRVLYRAVWHRRGDGRGDGGLSARIPR